MALQPHAAQVATSVAFGPTGEPATQFYAGCLVLALQHLHSLGIAYRDLKAENVLLTGGVASGMTGEAGWPVLTDFGLATFAKANEDLLYTFCGTPNFLAPEIANNVGYGTTVDWWSLGVLVCQCLTLATPFDAPTPQAILANISRGRRTMAQPLTGWGLSESASSFVEALLEPDPTSRLGGSSLGHGGTDEVRVHAFFWGLDWARLEKKQLPTPHAAQCHARAVAVTSHPDLVIQTPSRLPRHQPATASGLRA